MKLKENKKPEISIILPCLDEEKGLDFSLKKIKKVLKGLKNYEIIVVDNNSKDKSREVAKKHKVRLVEEKKRGYGFACKKGAEIAKGKYLLFIDADGSYDFEKIPIFLKELKNYDFIIGNRFRGKIEKNSIPFFHRYLGNPLLSLIIRIFFNSKIKDTQCGMRAFRKEIFESLNLKTGGMEFASEAIIKIARKQKEEKIKVKEIPINYYKRKGISKFRTLTDGLRHLRFIFLYLPLLVLLFPGFFLTLLGLFSLFYIFFFSFTGPEALILSSFSIIVGYEFLALAIFLKTYAINFLGEKPIFKNLYRYINFKTSLILGIFLFFIGVILTLFDPFNIKKFIISVLLLILGLQTIINSLILSVLGIDH